MKLDEILFLDIETVSDTKFIKGGEDLFMKRHKKQFESMDPIDFMNFTEQQSGLEAEFGKIVCISMGRVSGSTLYIKSIISEKEYDILAELHFAISKSTHKVYGGHNILSFDIPFIFRRCLINGFTVPKGMDFRECKPWEIHHIDTMKQWSNGEWNYKISLELLAAVLGLPSPKTEISGKDVGELFYSKDPDKLHKIKTYCEGDVITDVNCYCLMNGLPIFNELQIERL